MQEIAFTRRFGRILLINPFHKLLLNSLVRVTSTTSTTSSIRLLASKPQQQQQQQQPPSPSKTSKKSNTTNSAPPRPPPEFTTDNINAEIDSILSARRSIINSISLPTKRTGTNSLIQQLKQRFELSNDNTYALTRISQCYSIKLSTDPRNLSSDTWASIGGPARVRSHALGKNIFPDLVEEFRPQYNLVPEFDKEILVFRGNTLAPFLTSSAPKLHFDAPEVLNDQPQYYTLIAVDLDALIVDHEPTPDSYSRFTVDKFKGHRLHWLVSNIPGNQLSRGEVVAPWIQPLPAKGTGLHRIAFLLCKQQKPIALPPVDSFDARIEFPTSELIEQHNLTPCGLSFFTTSWDSSVSDFYQSIKITEPVYVSPQYATKLIKKENRIIPVSRFRFATE